MASIMSGETKIMKHNMVNSFPLAGLAVTWGTPYNNSSVVSEFLNPEIYTILGDANSPLVDSIGHFIEVGPGFDQRIGRRIKILSAKTKLVLQPYAFGKPPVDPADPIVYTFDPNCEFRVIYGWCKRGTDQLRKLQTGQALYSDISYMDYRVLGDRIINRRLMATGLPVVDAQGVGAYKNIVLNFTWRPKGLHQFSTDYVNYDGWSPFFKIINNQHLNIALSVEYCKNMIAYKDA
tara:strand:- start:370 stop:1074 length:705 start_codon:yes stop_codon:yes gene_type:complete